MILTAVVEGVATATEVSTIGVAYTVLICIVIYRQFDERRLYLMLVETATLSGAILLIVGGATAVAWALTQSGFSQALTAMMAAVPRGAVSSMAISIIVFVVLEGIPAMVLFGPLLSPIAKDVGINDLHYAVVVILAHRAVRAAVRAWLLRRLHPSGGCRPKPACAASGPISAR